MLYNPHPVRGVSHLASIQTVDESGKHPGNFFKIRLELQMVLGFQEFLTSTQFQQRHALLNGSTRNAKEVPAVGLGKSAIAFRDIGGDRQGCTVELIGQEKYPRGKPFVSVQTESAKAMAF